MASLPAGPSPSPSFAAPFAAPASALVWNYWFARRRLEGPPLPAVDPFDEGYAFDHALWFHGDDAVDAEIGRHFGALIEGAARGELDVWGGAPRDCLALVLLLDQFPRNAYRGTARAFAHDRRALEVTEGAIGRGFDRELAPPEALFFYLALVHSEAIGDARRGLAGIERLVTRCARSQQRFAKGWRTGTLKHLDVLERFGRYPHRNAALGRASTPAEEAFLRRPDFKALFLRSQTPREARAVGGPPAAENAPSGVEPRFAESARAEAGPHAAKSARAEAGPKLKILALHGFRQNGEVFRKRIRKLRLALDDVAEFTFVTSPLNYAPAGETRAATLAAFGELPEYAMQRVWWLASEDNREYQGFDRSVAFLESVFRAQGPFDGVVGFAQGGTLAALLAAMQPHPAIAFQFAICISAFPSRAEAHARYMRPGGIAQPSLHVLGRNDILVTPDRSIRLFEAFASPGAVLAKHQGGHFVPGAWPYGEMRAFVARFRPKGAAPAAGPGPDASEDGEARAAGARAYALIAAHSTATPLDVEAARAELRALAEAGHWGDLQALALLAHSSRGGAADGPPAPADEGSAAPAHDEASPLAAVHATIVSLFAAQLRRDLDAVASMPRGRDEATAGERPRRLLELLSAHAAPEEARASGGASSWPSPCAKHAPRVGSQVDRKCRLAKDVARELCPREAMLAFIARTPGANAPRAGSEAAPGAAASGPARRPRPQGVDLPTQAKNLSYQRYSQARSLLIGVLNEADPERARRQMRQVRAPHLAVREPPDRLRERPIPGPVVEPEPAPVVPCTAEELSPLLDYLRANAAVEGQRAFEKGTLTADGRLDLCKQVVGPEGIGPLLGAMMHSDRVRRLLLGNNVVGDGGAAAIARFLRERKDSSLDCWYVAGNRITAEGIRPLCEALAGDGRVRALWLKRNPLKAAGMAPIAALLRENRALEVLDLVNCGLLDEGLATLLGALRGPGANKTLRHLYVGTNGVTARSAPPLGAYLAEDCALESLYLSCNRLGDEGVEEIARGLAANRSLRRLSLASNLVGPRGARALAAALERHPRLELLDLGFTKATVAVGEYGNFLGDEGAAALARMLAQNDALRSLDVLHNFISQTGVNAIRDALAANRTLVSLQLTQFGRVHNEPGKEEIRAALRRNLALAPGGEGALAELELPRHVREIYSVYRTHL